MLNRVWGNVYSGHQYIESGRVVKISGNVYSNNFNDNISAYKLNKGYVITNYLPNGYLGNGQFNGVDLNYVLSYFKNVRCYVRGNNKGVWIETQVLPMDKCLALKKSLGTWFYKIIRVEKI